MPTKFRLQKLDSLSLRLKIQAASGLNQRTFDREIERVSEQKNIKICQSVAKGKVEEKDDDARYVMPGNLNPEQHLFKLAFEEPGNPLIVIDSAFREYDPMNGFWNAIDDGILGKRVLEIANKARLPDTKKGPGRSLGTAANVKKTLEHATFALFNSSKSISNDHLIAFRNGTVCVKTGQLSPHDPDQLLTSGLPYDYKQGSECPEPMRKYIESSFGADQMEYIRAALGLILDLTAPPKFIHAIGPSGSGKGVFLKLIAKLFGKKLIATPSNFQFLNKPETVHQTLLGRRAVVIDDIVKGNIGNEVSRFYSAVELSPLDGRSLFSSRGYSEQFKARWILASTSQLNMKHTTGTGWARRVFPLPTIGRPAEPNRNLIKELEDCLAETISWALNQDKQLRNTILEHPERYNVLADEYFIESAYSSSSAWAFLEECLEPVEPKPLDNRVDQDIDAHELYEAYTAYCASTGRSPLSLDNFKHELRDAIPSNHVRRQKDKGAWVPARFVYIKKVPGLFTKNDYGATTCLPSKLSYNGGLNFREWARNYGSLYPYKNIPEPTGTIEQKKLSTSAHNSGCNEPVTNNVVVDTKRPIEQGGQGEQGKNYEQNVCVHGQGGGGGAHTHTHTQHFQSEGALFPLFSLSRPEGNAIESDLVQPTGTRVIEVGCWVEWSQDGALRRGQVATIVEGESYRLYAIVANGITISLDSRTHVVERVSP